MKALLYFIVSLGLFAWFLSTAHVTSEENVNGLKKYSVLHIIKYKASEHMPDEFVQILPDSVRSFFSAIFDKLPDVDITVTERLGLWDAIINSLYLVSNAIVILFIIAVMIIFFILIGVLVLVGGIFTGSWDRFGAGLFIAVKSMKYIFYFFVPLINWYILLFDQSVTPLYAIVFAVLGLIMLIVWAEMASDTTSSTTSSTNHKRKPDILVGIWFKKKSR